MPTTKGQTKTPTRVVEQVYLWSGLAEQDDNYLALQKLFKEMQKVTVDTPNVDDVFSFAQFAQYFGVIMRKNHIEEVEGGEIPDEQLTDADADGEREEDMLDAYSVHDQQKALQRVGSITQAEKVATWVENLHSAEPVEAVPTPPSSAGIGAAGNGPFTPPQNNETTISSETPHQPTEYQMEDMDDLIDWPEEGLSSYNGSDVEAPMAVDSTTNPFRTGYRDHSPSLESFSTDLDFGLETLDRPYTPPAQAAIPEDPELQSMIANAAKDFQNLCRDTPGSHMDGKNNPRWVPDRRQPDRKSPSLQLAPVSKFTYPPDAPEGTPVGLIYLMPSQQFGDPLHVGEVMLGFYIDPTHVDNPLMARAIDEVIQMAFKDRSCHRLQAIVVSTNDQLSWVNRRYLSRAGFTYEGTRRLAFWSPILQEYRDVSYWGTLALQWAVDQTRESALRLRPVDECDELIKRHENEKFELSRWMENCPPSIALRRTASIETIRIKAKRKAKDSSMIAMADSEYELESNADSIFSTVNKPTASYHSAAASSLKEISDFLYPKKRKSLEEELTSSALATSDRKRLRQGQRQKVIPPLSSTLYRETRKASGSRPPIQFHSDSVPESIATRDDKALLMPDLADFEEKGSHYSTTSSLFGWSEEIIDEERPF